MMKDLIAIEASLEAETIEAKTYIKYHKFYGLKAEWLYQTFINDYDKETYKITGLSKKGRLAMITTICTNTNSPIFKYFEIKTILKYFN